MHPAHPTAREPWRGWAVLAVSSVALVATSPGQTFVVSLFNLAIREELGLSASGLSGAYMLATLGSASLMTWVGQGSDRWGPGRFMAGSAVGLWGATLWMSQIGSFATLTAGFFLLRLFGQGALSLASGHALAMWFERRLGVAEGIRLTVFGLGLLVVPSLVTFSIVELGWRSTFPLMGTVAAASVVLAWATLHRDRPEDIGETIDGAPSGSGSAPSSAIEGATLGQAVRRPAYWLVAAASVNSAMVVTALMFHVQPLAVARGLGPESAPGLIAAYAVLSTSLFFVCGWLGDHLRANLVFAAAAALVGVGSASFTTLAPAWGPYVGMGAMGTASALLGTTAAATLARCFGRASHGAIRGSVATLSVAGTAMGPFLLGASVDGTQSFDAGLWLFVGSGAAVVVLAGFAPIRPWKPTAG